MGNLFKTAEEQLQEENGATEHVEAVEPNGMEHRKLMSTSSFIISKQEIFCLAQLTNCDGSFHILETPISSPLPATSPHIDGGFEIDVT